MRILSAVGKLQEIRQEFCDPSVSSKCKFFLENVFVLLSDVANRSKLTSAVVIHMSLWKKNIFLLYMACPCD